MSHITMSNFSVECGVTECVVFGISPEPHCIFHFFFCFGSVQWLSNMRLHLLGQADTGRTGISRRNQSITLDTIMDLAHELLSLTPVPHLDPAFALLKFITSAVKQAKVCKGQLEGLAQSLALLLQTLDGQYRAGRLQQDQTLTPLTDLLRLVPVIVQSRL